MGMQTDVKSAPISTTGAVVDTRTRLKGMMVFPSDTAGSLVVRDGGASGTTLMTIPTLADGGPFPILIPGEGVLCYTDLHVTVSNATATVFYG